MATTTHHHTKSTFTKEDCDALQHITTLYCDNNQMTSFMNCPLLTTLDCGNNQITSFQHLNCPLLTRLYCGDNQITSLEHLNCPLLTHLSCGNNQITSFEHLNCPLLTTLSCRNSQITSFEHLNCPLLTTLYCGNNQITSFQHLNCPLLTYLYCGDDQITSFEHLNCPLLTYLDCDNNQITSFEHLNCPLLTYLYCYNNQITSFEHLNCPLLTYLYCNNNEITSFEHLNCPRLTTLICEDNEIEYVPPHIARIINGTKRGQNVYGDAQNVHNHAVQESIRKSISAIMNQKPSASAEAVLNKVLEDSVLTEKAKRLILEYASEKEVHGVLDVSFKELLQHVWSRMCLKNEEEKKEMKLIMNGEMEDSDCKCFTGRMSRLVNVLNGFDTLVTISISDTEQMSQVIIMVKESLEREGKYTVEKHREESIRELVLRGYSEEAMLEWISYIE